MAAAIFSAIMLDARSAIACVASAVLGFAGLALLGWQLSATSYIDPEHFHRFHLYINPQTLYYPTASQVVTLAKASVQPGQTAVILGGSSLTWGAGLSDSELWSRHLQANLGDDYRVVNLAMPSGSPQEHGGVAAQALLKDGYKVVFISDLGAIFGPPDGLFYPYVYWDAFYKGFLLENIEGQQRIQQVSPSRTLGGPLEELRFQGALGRWLYFTDLWNAFSYKVLFTAWNWLVHPPTAEFYTPRGTLADPQPSYPAEARHSQPAFETALDIVKGYLVTACPKAPTGPGGADGAAAYWASFRTEAEAAFPEPFRRHTLIVRLFQSRFYRDALNPQENACYAQSFNQASAELRSLGYEAADVGADWSVDDYIDITHVSAAGGERMARELAQEVRRIAAGLGYDRRVG